MRVLKPATDKKWIFRAIDGPSLTDIMFEFFDGNKRDCSRTLMFCFEQRFKGDHFDFEQDMFEWSLPKIDWTEKKSENGWVSVVNQTAARSTWIRVKITEIVKISDLPLKFIITGYCPDIVLRECPFAFKALYSFISNKGKFVFSFKYGRWIEIDNSDIGEPNNYIKGMIIGKRKIMRV